MPASRVRPAARWSRTSLGIGTVERGGLRQVGVDDDGREGLARRRFGQCARFDVKGRILESVEGEAGFPCLLGAAFGCVIVGLHRAVDLVADRGAEKRSVGVYFLGEFETDARAGRGVAQLQAAPAGQVFPEIVEVGPFAVGFRNSLHADGDHFAYGPFGRHALRFETGGGTRCGVFHDRLPVRIVVRAPLRNLLPGVVYFAPVDVVFADRTRRGPPCQVGGRRGLRAVGVIEDELRPQAGLAVAHRAAPCDPLVVPAVAEDDAEFDLLLPCAGEPAADVGRNVETAQFVVGLGRTHDAVPVRVVSVYEEFVPAGGADIGPCRDDGFVEPDGAAQVGGTVAAGRAVHADPRSCPFLRSQQSVLEAGRL